MKRYKESKLIIPWRYKPKVWYWRILRLFRRKRIDVMWKAHLRHGVANNKLWLDSGAG